MTRPTLPTCRAHYPDGPDRCACRLLPRLRGLPRNSGGAAPAPSRARPAQASLTLRPVGLLSRPRRPLSRGFGPAGCPSGPLVSYQEGSTQRVVGSRLRWRARLLASHLGRFRAGERSDCASLAHVGWEGDAGGLEQRADDPGRGRAQGHLAPLLGDRHVLEPIEAAHHVAPLGPEARPPAALVQFLAEHERQERAEHVPPDRRVRRVVDRPRAHQRLGGPEQLLYPDEVAIAQHRLERRDAGVGAQHEDAVVTRLLGQLADVDLERSLAGAAQVVAVAGVADQRLLAPLELFVERGHDGPTVGRILPGLGFVETDDVAPPLRRHLLDEGSPRPRLAGCTTAWTASH